jgi:ABC-2 type transport system ATP-binding protein
MIATQDLCKSYRHHGALKNLTLSVPEGSAFALVGANGAGKTTLIKILMNLIEPSSGEATVLGVDSRHLQPRELRSIGYVSENQELPSRLTVSQYLRYLRGFYPEWSVVHEQEMLKQFLLPEDRRIGELSHGMRVKLALTSVLPYRPRLLVLDEPFSGLDPLVRDEFMEALAGRSEDMTVLISSHDLGEVEGFASDIAFIDRGALLFQESMESLIHRVQAIKVTVETASNIREPIPKNWIEIREFGNVITFVDTDFSQLDLEEQLRSRLVGIRHVEIESLPLRSIFTSLARSMKGQAC